VLTGHKISGVKFVLVDGKSYLCFLLAITSVIEVVLPWFAG